MVRQVQPCPCVFASTGEQGAGVGESAGGGSLVQSAGSCGGGREDHPGFAGSDRWPGTHQLHQLRRSGALILQQRRTKMSSDSLRENQLALCCVRFVCTRSCLSRLFVYLGRLPSIQMSGLFRLYWPTPFGRRCLHSWQHRWEEFTFLRATQGRNLIFCLFLKSVSDVLRHRLY